MKTGLIVLTLCLWTLLRPSSVKSAFLHQRKILYYIRFVVNVR